MIIVIITSILIKVMLN